MWSPPVSAASWSSIWRRGSWWLTCMAARCSTSGTFCWAGPAAGLIWHGSWRGAGGQPVVFYDHHDAFSVRGYIADVVSRARPGTAIGWVHLPPARRFVEQDFTPDRSRVRQRPSKARGSSCPSRPNSGTTLSPNRDQSGIADRRRDGVTGRAGTRSSRAITRSTRRGDIGFDDHLVDPGRRSGIPISGATEPASAMICSVAAPADGLGELSCMGNGVSSRRRRDPAAPASDGSSAPPASRTAARAGIRHPASVIERIDDIGRIGNETATSF